MSESTEPVQPNPDADQLELKLPDESSSLKDLGLWSGVLALLTLVAFWQATTGAFLWRDNLMAQAPWLYKPATLQESSGLSAVWFGRWTHPNTFSLPVYQPVALTAYWLEFRAGGKNDLGQPAPMAYHVASLIFLAVSAILLWLILRELRIPGAWIIAAIFALHPIHAEPVSWISEQATVLAGMFFIASIYCYLMFIQWRERDIAERAAGNKEGIDPAQTWGLFSGSVVCFLFAILSDPSATFLPVVLILLLWWKKKLTSQDGLLITPMIIVSIALWLATADTHHNAGEASLLHSSVLIQAIMFGRGLWFSVYRLIVPIHFSALDFPVEKNGAIAAGFYIFWLFATLLMTVLVGVIQLTGQRVMRGLFVALVMFVLLVLSSMNWFDPSRRSPLTDCVAYLAMVPIITLVVVLISGIKLPGPHPQTAVGVCTAILLAFGLLSWTRTRSFENSMALWRDVASNDPTSVLAQTSLASELRIAANEDFAASILDPVEGERNEAIEHAQNALNLEPRDAFAQRIWANVLVDKGDISHAIPHFDQAIALDPNNPSLRSEYAKALIVIGKFSPAIEQLDQALRGEPFSSNIHQLMGTAYKGLGDRRRAIAEEQLALQYNPRDVAALQALAEIQAEGGTPEDLKNAAANYFHIFEYYPDLQKRRPDLWLAVADIVQRQGDLENALTLLKTAEEGARDDADMLKKVEAEIDKVKKMATTRPSTRPSTGPSTLPGGTTLPM
jgi:tetratricopeptide (TPR) repeat protein